jgi:glycosyltransferase involved in cell wall biosynthesis
MSERLTVLIPCKDEQLNIRACIESARPVADEILIADSGSRDATLDIVRSMGGCRTIQRVYVNSANFKNWAIPQARHRWVLIVDADERVTDDLAREINEIKADPPSQLDGYWIRRQNSYLGHPMKHCGLNRDKVLRLFRRDACRYEERWVHAEVQIPPERVGWLRSRLLHQTASSSDHHLKKLIRYAQWGAMNMRDAGRRPSLFKMFTRLPARFLQLYFLRLGFLDGVPGLEYCMAEAFYSFLKQVMLWEMDHALPQPDDQVLPLRAVPQPGDQVLPLRKVA